jgi:hypothetical protein
MKNLTDIGVHLRLKEFFDKNTTVETKILKGLNLTIPLLATPFQPHAVHRQMIADKQKVAVEGKAT